MPLPSGTRLGPYEILASVGAGGMGEVYRARDTRLGREIAVKILPSQFLSDPVRLSRFEKEARSASALNHPNIITIHEIGQFGETSYIIMELVDGKTLREILSGGTVPVRKTLDIAAKIAEGLAKAHSAGIVHRDLKPENVMITNDGLVKILDFGLAKLLRNDDSIRGGPEAQTMSATQPGVVLGTVGYMSPEQASGDTIDFRSDQFSLGSILYEMTTGKRAFQRSSAVATLSAILHEEPESIGSVAPSVPTPIRWIIERCLAKNPDDRYASTKDLARDLATLHAHSSEIRTSGEAIALAPGKISSAKRSVRFAWGVTAMAIFVAVITGIVYFKRIPKPSPALRFYVSAPENSTFLFAGRDAGPVTVSPDGSRLAFVATTKEGKRRLFVRALDSLSARPLEGTDGASYPFWSPDNRFLGFFADGKLKKIEAARGSVQAICDAPFGRGGTWNDDGVILFSPGVFTPLYRVSSNGGPVMQVTKIEKSSSEYSHRWPSFLPDGRHFLYLGLRPILIGQKAGHRIYIGTLDGKENRFLLTASSRVSYAWPGYLLFVREATLLAMPFDARKLDITGEAILVVEQVQAYLNTASAVFSVSENGVLAYQAGAAAPISQLGWFDRSGLRIATLGPPGDYEDPDLSPDGTRVAFNRIDSQTGITNIWFHEVSQNRQMRYTFSPSYDHHAVWSPDQSRIIFDSNRNGPAELYQKALHGTGSEELLFQSNEEKTPNGFSPDGRLLVYQSNNDRTKWDLWLLPLRDRTPSPFLRTENNELGAQISPDGRWAAYTSDESGRWEVYVTGFPAAGGKWQISTTGGMQPRWRHDGKELFYLSADRKLMCVEIKEGNSFESGETKPLFDTRSRYTGNVAYDVSTDGQKFLINSILSDETSPPLTVVVNWIARLKQ